MSTHAATPSGLGWLSTAARISPSNWRHACSWLIPFLYHHFSPGATNPSLSERRQRPLAQGQHVAASLLDRPAQLVPVRWSSRQDLEHRHGCHTLEQLTFAPHVNLALFPGSGCYVSHSMLCILCNVNPKMPTLEKISAPGNVCHIFPPAVPSGIPGHSMFDTYNRRTTHVVCYPEKRENAKNFSAAPRQARAARAALRSHALSIASEHAHASPGNRGFRGHNTNCGRVMLTLQGRAGRFVPWRDWRELWFGE